MPSPPATPSFSDDLAAVQSSFADDLKAAQTAVDNKQPVPHPLVQRLLSWLPAAGGTAGAIAGEGVLSIPAAALGGAAGESGRELLNRAVGNPAPSSMGDAASAVAGQGAVQGAAEGIGQAALAGVKAGGPWLMTKAAKPAARLLEEFRTTAPALAKTLADEGVNVTRAGVDKLTNLLTATQGQLRSLVQAAPQTIPKTSVAAEVLPTAQRIAAQVNPTDDLRAVGDSVSDFLSNPSSPGPTLSVADAQAMKTGTYRKLAGSYGEQGSAAVETQKALARGIKNEINAAVPEAASLNAREAKLMAAREAVAKQVGLVANRDPVGLMWLSRNPDTALGWLLEKSPAIKSMVARGLYGVADRVSGLPAGTVQTIVHSVAGLGSGAQLPAVPSPQATP